ncbi:MAG: tail fiber domain-containing protein, partial [Chthonomonadaceae bacterium]|nr:tail fiber domain-containing protein [Chthonomonadaceae bacterium]
GYYGVYGAGSTTGVYGVSSGTNGVYGPSTGSGGNGVLGECNNGTQAYGVWGKSTSGYAGYFSGKVNVTGAFTNTSDARYKKNIATFENALDVVMNLRGVTYDWRKTEFAAMNFSEGKQVGLIAQEVEKVLPELVITDGNGYKSVAYVNLIPVLVEAIKTMKSTHEAEIRVLTEENALKEARLAELEAKYKALADAVSKLQKNRK